MRALPALVLVAACQASAAPSPREAPKEAPTAAPTPAPPRNPGADLITKVQTLRFHMHVRFAAAQRLQQAIAFSDLDRARGEAKIIAELAEPDVLPAWQPYIEQIRGAARQVVLAPDLATAANMSALLGRRCAQCHTAAKAKITFAQEPAPAERARLASYMASHQWATRRLWEGLIGPSPQRWRDGARTLVRAPLTIVAEADDLPPEVAITDDVSRLRLFATRALEAKTPEARAELYGRMLQTCVQCHMTIRDR